MKKFLKPTKQKIIFTPVVAVLYFVALNVIEIALLYNDNSISPTKFPCSFSRFEDNNSLPFMTPNATLFSEWQKVGTLRCGPESQLQEVFLKTKHYLMILFFLVVCYLIACAIVTFTTRKNGQKKPG